MRGFERFSTKPEFGDQQDAEDFLQVLVSKLESEVKCIGSKFGHTDNCLVPMFEGREQLVYKLVNSEDGSCPICFEMPDAKEEPFEIIQELIWENIEQQTVLERRCSKCEYGHVPKFKMKIKSKVSDELLAIGNKRFELYAIMDHLGTRPNNGHWIVWLSFNL